MSIWTTDEVVHLIRTMKNYPIMYSRAIDLTTDLSEYVATIEEIEKVVNKPWSEINAKWKSLRSYHKVCYNKQLKTKQKPAWIYYDLMDYAADSENTQSVGQEDSDEDPDGDKPENLRQLEQDTVEPITEQVRKSIRVAKRVANRRKSCPISQPRSQQARTSRRISVAQNSSLMTTEETQPTKDSYSDYIDIISFKLYDINQRFGEQEGKVAALSLFECLSRFEMKATDRFLANED